jgi:signal transduction histidine kinase
MKLTQLVVPDYLDELEVFHKIKVPTDRVHNIEIECFRKDLSTISVEFLMNYIAGEKVIYGVVHDITDKKQLQKNIVKAIIQTEEKERAYFSKELHDGLGPLLSTIKLYLQWSERPNTNARREEIIRQAEDIIEDALTTVKEISNKLSPHLLTNHGLSSAIQSFAGKVEQSSNIRIDFESDLKRRLDDEIEAAIYRATIECINNSIKHAKASNISILINDADSQLLLHYQDDGIGFNLEETLARKKGLGLFNLQNRIQTIGGKISMFSKPGHGVDYQITIGL